MLTHCCASHVNGNDCYDNLCCAIKFSAVSKENTIPSFLLAASLVSHPVTHYLPFGVIAFSPQYKAINVADRHQDFCVPGNKIMTHRVESRAISNQGVPLLFKCSTELI